MITSHFEKIQDHIIDELKSARKSIEIAIAWFTNRNLFQALLDARKHGVVVSLLIQDDVINRGVRHGLLFQDLIDQGGNLFLYKNSGVLMHNKFCVIDGKKLITGSYNWTYAAEFNNEENIIISDEQSLCDQFSSHFKNLKANIEKTKTYVQIGYDINSFHTYSKMDELSEELFYMQDNDICMNDGKTPDAIISKIHSSREEYKIHNHYTHNRYIVSENIGIKSEGDKMLIFIEKGTPLPCLKTMDTVTFKDNQENGNAYIYYGLSEKITENERIGTVRMPNIPQRKAGDVRFRDTIFVDTDGHISYSFICLNNGNKARDYFDCPNIVTEIIP